MKILFIGDSITDADRDKSNGADLGDGYVSLLAEKLRPLYEDMTFTFINRGVAGSRIADVEARLEADLAEKPDIVILLAGINDVWHKYLFDTPFDEQSSADSFMRICEKVKDTGAKLIVAEPFLLDVPDKKRFRREFDKLLAAIKGAAQQYADGFIALDEIFAGVSRSVSVSAYSADGIHPTHRAARLIADNLIKKIRPFLA